MRRATAERIPTFEELYQAIQALPPGLTGEILEPGVIRTMGRPGGPHRIGARAILRSLGDDDAWAGGRGWWLEQEAEIRFADKLAVPDLSGWRVGEAEPLPPPFVFDNPIVRCPDWCCELLSQSTHTVDRDIKVPLYANAGVGWIWLVDPEGRRAEIVRSENRTAALVEVIEGDVIRVIPPFESVIDTSRWWVAKPER